MSARGRARRSFQQLIVPVIFVLAILAIGAGFSTFSSTIEPKQNDPNDISPFAVDEALPASDIVSSDGVKVQLNQLLPAKAIVTFWSASCAECSQLLKDQQELLGTTSLPVALINIQDAPATGAKKLTELGVTFATYYDQDSTTFRAWQGTIPASYYVANGRIKYFFPGRMSKEHIQSLLTLL